MNKEDFHELLSRVMSGKEGQRASKPNVWFAGQYELHQYAPTHSMFISTTYVESNTYWH